MTLTNQIVTQIHQLPSPMAAEVLNFIDFLKFKAQFENLPLNFPQYDGTPKLPELSPARETFRGLSEAFELLTHLSDDFMAEGRRELLLETREVL